jgi:hypothetical protein
LQDNLWKALVGVFFEKMVRVRTGVLPALLRELPILILENSGPLHKGSSKQAAHRRSG